jgi:hypothetical protein
MAFLSVAKLFGVIALLQIKFHTVKEWAFAGFAFVFIGAFISKACLGDTTGSLLAPLIMLLILFGLYYFWRRLETAEAGLAS